MTGLVKQSGFLPVAAAAALRCGAPRHGDLRKLGPLCPHRNRQSVTILSAGTITTAVNPSRHTQLGPKIIFEARFSAEGRFLSEKR